LLKLAPANRNLPVGVAVSGGPDSVALLLLAHAALPAVEAATVDHGLRRESTAEANSVAALCLSLGVPHAVLPVGPRESGNVSAWARKVRYAALGVWAERRKLAAFMTAHHADDQLETMIMRLNRGSGTTGLSGIRARTGLLIRPVLEWRKSELKAVVDASGVTTVKDPSNSDDRFDRARLRKALSGADWLDPAAASRSAAALADADDALNWITGRTMDKQVSSQDGIISFAPDDLPHELVRRLVCGCLREINADSDPRGEPLERLITTLRAGKAMTLANVKCSGGKVWRFEPEKVRRPQRRVGF
jgi:tRNA(Ile)-lysidine synthase